MVLEKGSFSNWYVDDEGSDSNNGSLETPFQTIGKAINQENWKPGDIINVRAGERFGSTTPNDNAKKILGYIAKKDIRDYIKSIVKKK